MSNIIEALLFAVGEDGLSIEELANIIEEDEDKIKEALESLEKSYEDRAIEIKMLGNKYKLITKVEYKDYLKKLTDVVSNSLSKSALETLAIIAYNEPVTRFQIDEIRGINSSQMLRNLISKGLIEVIGKDENAPGRPNLYKTTNEFLDYFNLSNISELPEIEEIEEILEDDDLYKSRYREEEEL